MKWPMRMVILSSFIAGLCMVLLDTSIFLAQETATVKSEPHGKEEHIHSIRRRQLSDIQKHIFNPLKRPKDEVYNINVTLSDHTPLDRDIVDSRPRECKTIKYDLASLGKISVVIPFHDEALSLLLRTVHSILRRTPPQLLEEIIIVDDSSTYEDLKEPLAKYVYYLDKTRLHRTQVREGLMRARQIGAQLAKGSVLVFQDAHTENNAGWAEPLLEELRKNPHQVIQPHVEVIDALSLKYYVSSESWPRGGFSWDLRYTWMRLPGHERQRLKSSTDPQRTATLVGCAMAIRRDYFFHLGGFDDGMNIWGGENIELAFRTWLCNGQVMMHRCSRVGHIFRDLGAYSFNGDKEKIVMKNLMRIAEMWMGSYKKYFYAATYFYHFKRTYFEPKELISLQKRKEFMKKLNCKPFDWFMKNIVPEIPRPPDDATYYGEIKNLASGSCFYVKDDGYIGLTHLCYYHRVIPENLFHIDERNRLKYNDKCVLLDKDVWRMYLGECLKTTNPDIWDVIPYKRGTLGHIRLLYWSTISQVRFEVCVMQVTTSMQPDKGTQMPEFVECDLKNRFQIWRWTYRFRFDYNFQKPKVQET